MKVYISLILLILCFNLYAQTCNIENVRFEQRTDGSLMVDIYYDAASIDDHFVDISIEASGDHGATWTLPCLNLVGDVGEGISPGADKHVVWDFYADNPDTSGDGYRIRVTATDSLYIPKVHSSFMFHDGQAYNGDPFSHELGINTTPIYLDNWASYEINDNEWNWDHVIAGNEETFDHVIARLGIIHVWTWNPHDWIPTWIDRDDLDGQLKQEYGEFVTAAVEYLSNRPFDVDLYLVEMEANCAITDIGKSNTWVIDWIKWETDLIKAADPNAKVAIALANTDMTPNNIVGDGTDDYILMYGVPYIKRMIDVGVDFDVLAFSIRGGVYNRCDDWTVMAAYVDTLLQFDKELYVYDLSYPAGQNNGLEFYYPREGGYSEEWQAEQYVESLRFLLETDKVIGAAFPMYDVCEPPQLAPYEWGLVAGEGLQPGTGTKRLSFDAVKEFWRANHR